MKKLFGDVKISEEEIADIMANDIIKREIIDSEESKKVKKDIDKIYKKLERIRERSNTASSARNSSEDDAEEKVESPDQEDVDIEERAEGTTS